MTSSTSRPRPTHKHDHCFHLHSRLKQTQASSRTAQSRPSNILQHELHSTADHSVGAVARPECAQPRIDPRSGADGTRHDCARRGPHRRSRDAVCIEVRVQETLNGGKDRCEMARLAPSHHSVDCHLTGFCKRTNFQLFIHMQYTVRLST